MKMRMIRLNPDFLLKSIQGRTTSFASNLPNDVELIDIKYDLFSNEIFAVIRSSGFTDVADAHPTPEFNVVYSTSINGKSVIESKFSTKSQHRTLVSVGHKNKPVEKMPVAANQDVRAVEEEFSPEQRELLTFTVDGDYVVIKPTQYLKSEWNEINNVVKSLGGKWVKGDFFSYWEIPPE